MNLPINTDSSQIYRVSKGWKIFFFFLTPPLMALMGWGAFMPFFEHRSHGIIFVVSCLVMCLGVFFLLAYSLIEISKARLEILPDRIRDVGVFTKRELRYDEIEGFKILPTQYTRILVFVPKSSKKKRIKVALILERQNELLKWIEEKYPNLDTLAYNKELETILHDESLGHSKEERARVLDRARKWARFLNIFSIAIGLWGIFRPQPYEVVIWILITMPLLALFFLQFFSGVLKFETNRQSAHPDISPSFWIPSVGLAIRALSDWNILLWESFWLPFGCLTIILHLQLLIFASDVRKQVSIRILAFIFCCLYGYGIIVTVNGLLDSSAPVVYQVQVLDKEKCEGKTTSCYLIVSPWGPRTSKNKVEVFKSVYKRTAIGETVTIYVRRGALKIPFYIVQ